MLVLMPPKLVPVEGIQKLRPQLESVFLFKGLILPHTQVLPDGSEVADLSIPLSRITRVSGVGRRTARNPSVSLSFQKEAGF